MTNLKNVLCWFICAWACLLPPQVNAQDNPSDTKTLTVTPKRCVALRQGQVCYQNITFTWQQATIGNYCLVELSTLNNIQCWSQQKMGKFTFDFQSDKSKTFVLRHEGKEDNLATTDITVSWVFKSSKRPRSSWKLF